MRAIMTVPTSEDETAIAVFLLPAMPASDDDGLGALVF